MRIYICIMVSLLMGGYTSQAQRMMPKQNGLEISAGVLSADRIGYDYYMGLGMTIHGKNGNYAFMGGEYSHRYYTYKEIRVPVETYTAESGYSFFMVGDHRRNVALNFGVSAIAGYEAINRGEVSLYDGATILNESKWIYGSGSRLSLETYLSDRIVLAAQGKVKALWGTDLELLRASVGLGLRFNF